MLYVRKGTQTILDRNQELVMYALKVIGHTFLLYDFIQLLKPSVKMNNFCQL